MWGYNVSLLSLVCVLGTVLSVSPVLKDFPPAILQRHIQEARHVPVCVIFRKNNGSRLEQRTWGLWNEGMKEKHPYAYWQLGTLPSDQSTVVGIEGRRLPLLRCYLSPRRTKDYKGKVAKAELATWLNNQVQAHQNGLPEGSLSAVQNSTLHHRLTIVGFASYRNHHAIEEILAEMHEKWWEEYPVYFVHPHNPDVKELAALCGTIGGPSLVILGRGRVYEGPGRPVYQIKSQPEITVHNLQVFLTASTIDAVGINQNNFNTLLEESKHYVPTLVCLYAWWAPHVLSYLSAYQRTIEELTSLNVKFNFALLEVNSETQYVIGHHIGVKVAMDLPRLILFSTKWERKTVVGVKQQVFPGYLPTPGEVIPFLKVAAHPLHTLSGEEITYQPWGHFDPTQMSLAMEGPLGRDCGVNTHNETDNTPRTITLKYIKPNVANVTQHPKVVKVVYKNPVEALLPSVEGIAMVTDDLWQNVIELSHAPSHPLYQGAPWRGEVTQVTLVIFIIDDCASCRKKMKLFGQLNTAIRAVEGGNVFLMNCSQNPVQCGRHNVSGYPTLAAYRGLGWLHGERCLSAPPPASPSSSSSSRLPYRYFFYHGALVFEHVMGWFAETAAPALDNLRFDEPEWDETKSDVWLVAYVIPQHSDYLHRARLNYRHLYNYKCFRFACEQLYGQAACYIRFSPNVPAGEFESPDSTDDMAITQIILERRDGLTTQVMRLGEPLMDTLEEEAQNTIHNLHTGHRYDIRTNQRCEDDPATCTEYVVQFLRDHARLSVSQVTMTMFHSPDSVLTSHSQPILLAFGHQQNLTEKAKYYKTLQTIGRLLYQDVVTLSVDVDQFRSWANRFVPRGYADLILNGEPPHLYSYPRFCLVYWHDHTRAAFYPGLKTAPLSRYKHSDIISFVGSALADPHMMFVDTEHF